MTDANVPANKPPLGVGSILGESFSLSFQNILGLGVIFLIAFVPLMLLIFATIGTVLFETAGQEEFFAEMMLNNPVMFWAGFGLFFLIVMLVTCFYFAAAIRLIFSARMGAKVGIMAAVGSGLSATPRLFVTLAALGIAFTVVIGLLVGIASVIGVGGVGGILGFAVGIAILVLYFWVMGVFAPLASASVLENRWLSSIGRSIALTKGYRWPIVGLFVLLFLAIFVVSLVLGVLTGILSVAGVPGAIVAIIIEIGQSVVLYAVMVACITLVYARLVEIKEGTSMKGLAEVFA